MDKRAYLSAVNRLKHMKAEFLQKLDGAIYPGDEAPPDQRSGRKLLPILGVAFLAGLAVPLADLMLGWAYPAGYDHAVLEILYFGVLPYMPLIAAAVAVFAIAVVDRGKWWLKGTAAFGLGATLGVAFAHDWWYYLPFTVTALVVFAFWYAHRLLWSSGPILVVIVSSVAGMLLMGTVLDLTNSKINFDHRFSTALEPRFNGLAVGLYLVTVIGILVIWAFSEWTQGRYRNRVAMLDLILRDVRCTLFFDTVIDLSRLADENVHLRRLNPAATLPPTKVPMARYEIWTKLDQKLARDNTNGRWGLGYWLASWPPVRNVACHLRPPQRPPRIDSTALLDLLEEARLRERRAYLASYFGPEITSSLIMRGGDKARERWHLIRISGEKNAPEYIEVGREAVTVGRSEKMDCVIKLDSVSGHHCTLEWKRTGLTVTDHGSTNGTLINGNPVSIGFLQENGLLAIGGVEFHLRRLCASPLEELLKASPVVRDHAVARADGHFAKYVLLSEAHVEASCYFGITAVADEPDVLRESARTWRSCIRGGHSKDEGDGPKAGDWPRAEVVYERLWIDNLDRLVATRGLTCSKSMVGDEADPVDFRELTRNLLTCRRNAQAQETPPPRAAANLALSLFLLEKPDSVESANELTSYLERMANEDPRSRWARPDAAGWRELSLACLANLFYYGSQGDWDGGGMPFTFLVEVASHPLGKRGLAHAKALYAFEMGARWDHSACGGEAGMHVQGAVSAYGDFASEEKEDGERLRLAFLANLIRSLPATREDEVKQE